jgi:putative endonuclease
MHFVYLIYNQKTEKFYIGSTDNLKRRLLEHQIGDTVSTSHESEHWHLVYTEVYKSKTDALIREKKLKAHGSGLVELKKRIGNSLSSLQPKTGEGRKVRTPF